MEKTTINCPRCHKQNDREHKYCMNCGQLLKRSDFIDSSKIGPRPIWQYECMVKFGKLHTFMKKFYRAQNNQLNFNVPTLIFGPLWPAYRGMLPMAAIIWVCNLIASVGFGILGGVTKIDMTPWSLATTFVIQLVFAFFVDKLYYRSLQKRLDKLMPDPETPYDDENAHILRVNGGTNSAYTAVFMVLNFAGNNLLLTAIQVALR